MTTESHADLPAVMAGVRDLLLAAGAAHEGAAHGGRPCWTTRAEALGFLCHSLGVRGGRLWDVEQALAGHDARCAGCAGCPDVTLREEPT